MKGKMYVFLKLKQVLMKSWLLTVFRDFQALWMRVDLRPQTLLPAFYRQLNKHWIIVWLVVSYYYRL